MWSATAVSLAALLGIVLACDSCYGPSSEVVHERLVRRMQPSASNATSGPRGPLQWGQLNFIHTTDTHGWLEGHLKEENYGADWGDFASFQTNMKRKAQALGVDLLTIDTGDLHDGNGLSDAASPNGVLSSPLFSAIDYDILTIGNHELYISEIAYETFSNFSKAWGEKYLTSNVQIYNPASSAFEYIGRQYRYFTTNQGLRVMTFGVLFDFTGNSNVSKVTTAAVMVKQQWFIDAVNSTEPIDLFLVVGHNPIRSTDYGTTFPTVLSAIKAIRPNTPIQVFGGHSHIRDFQVYDDRSTGLESGRYCETLGWLSMSGINSSTYRGVKKPHGVLTPTQKPTNTSTSGLLYSRRYLDWNRRTFEYHAANSQTLQFDTRNGLNVTSEISTIRTKLDLASLYGCAPATYCASCAAYGSAENIFTLVATAMGAEVVNASRSTIPRYIIVNTGSIRFDLVKGPFTYDDSFIVSPFDDAFVYIPKVPYAMAKNVLDGLNNAVLPDKRSIWGEMPLVKDTCVDPTLGYTGHKGLKTRGVTRRQTVVTPGYTTTDDFGTDGDDTIHSEIAYYEQPDYVQGNASFPVNGSDPSFVDVVFLDYFASSVISVLGNSGANYTLDDVSYYIDPSFTTQSYLPAYAKDYWQANLNNCTVGEGVGSTD